MVLTAVLAVLRFIAGQIFMKLAEPAMTLRGYIGIVNGDLLMYADKAAAISTPKKRMILYPKHAAKTSCAASFDCRLRALFAVTEITSQGNSS
jgi:hypothetical protein